MTNRFFFPFPGGQISIEDFFVGREIGTKIYDLMPKIIYQISINIHAAVKSRKRQMRQLPRICIGREQRNGVTYTRQLCVGSGPLSQNHKPIVDFFGSLLDDRLPKWPVLHSFDETLALVIIIYMIISLEIQRGGEKGHEMGGYVQERNEQNSMLDITISATLIRIFVPKRRKINCILGTTLLFAIKILN